MIKFIFKISSLGGKEKIECGAVTDALLTGMVYGRFFFNIVTSIVRFWLSCTLLGFPNIQMIYVEG